MHDNDDNDAALRTRAEATDHRETSRHSDVLAFLDALCARTPLCQRQSFGQSGEGQDLAALVVSDDGCFTPEAAQAQGKLIVMICANIHAGEVEGKESVLALCRDLTLSPSRAARKILSRLCLVVIPNFNPDGNDRISPDNRRLDLQHLEGQVNPEGGVGTRYTGQGWNLNRDATKQEAPETRALAALHQRFWPHVFIDCHTTDGSLHAFDLTYDTSRSNQPLFSGLLRKSRAMLEQVSRRVEERHGFRSYWYGNFNQPDEPTSGWRTYPALPRFGSHYRGLLGRIDVLLETYSYLDFPRRCEVIYAWLHELLRHAAKRHKRLLRAVNREEARIIARGAAADPQPRVGINYGVARRGPDGALLFDYPAYADAEDTAEILSFDRESLRARRYPGAQLQRYRAPHERTFIPTVTVSTPLAYLCPASLAERLRAHGITFEVLPEATELQVESYLVLCKERTHSPDVAGVVAPAGGAEVPLSQDPPPLRFETVLAVRPERQLLTLPAGALRVPTAQRAGTLAMYLLEPHSDDGFARWQFFDAEVINRGAEAALAIEEGGYYPIHRQVCAPAARKEPVI